MIELLKEAKRYYEQLAPHAKDRKTSELLKQLIDALDNQWQPIETAPLKKWILVVDECGQVKTEFFKEGFEFSFFAYWQPLPQPPKENKNE